MKLYCILIFLQMEKKLITFKHHIDANLLTYTNFAADTQHCNLIVIMFITPPTMQHRRLIKLRAKRNENMLSNI